MVEAQNILMCKATPAPAAFPTATLAHETPPRANVVTLETAVYVHVLPAGEDGGDGGGAVVETKQGGRYRGGVVVLAGGSYTAWLAAASGLVSIAPPTDDAAVANNAAASCAAVSDPDIIFPLASLAPSSASNNADPAPAAVVAATPAARSGVGSIRLSRRTVLLAEVTEVEAKGALAGMPTIKYQCVPVPPLESGRGGAAGATDPAAAHAPAGGAGNSHSRNEATSVYVLPPIKYPGPEPPTGWYVKIGGGANDFFERDRWGDTVEDLEAGFMIDCPGLRFRGSLRSWGLESQGFSSGTSRKARNPEPKTRYTKPDTRDPRPETRDPKPKTQNPKP
jgi:hypothetical protein